MNNKVIKIISYNALKLVLIKIIDAEIYSPIK